MNGLVVMAYGTPSGLDDVEAYYTHVRRGRPPSPQQLADLVRRYETIGVSPLRSITDAQAGRLAKALGTGWTVSLGFKHASPFIEDAARGLVEIGCDALVGVVLAPHDSRGSVGEYVTRLDDAAHDAGVPATSLRFWHDLPAWRSFQTAAVEDGLATLPNRTTALFTAHSLPERVLAGDDPYPAQLAESASAIAAATGLDPAAWRTCWQSAGATPEPWRGPDVLEVIAELSAAGGTDGVLVCPQGFTADHLEVLYDLDVVAAEHARGRGVAFGRTRSVNDDALVLDALAERVGALA